MPRLYSLLFYLCHQLEDPFRLKSRIKPYRYVAYLEWNN